MRAFFVVSALAIVSHEARADDPAYVPPDFLQVTPELPGGSTGAMKLDLAEALRLAVKQNLEINLERKSLEVAALGIVAAEGSFEPTVNASYAHNSSRTPPQTNLMGMAGSLVEAALDTWSIGASQRFTTGTTLDVSYSNGRSTSTSNDRLDDKLHRSGLDVRVSQPILRGFSTDFAIPRIDILRAELASERERQKLVVSIADLVERTETAYWELLQAIYRYDLAKRSLALAEDQRALTQRQIDSGTLPPSDAIGAESTLAGRKLGLLQEEEAIARSSDQLRSILNLPREQWSTAIVPTEAPTFAPVKTTVDDAFAQAIKGRPELADFTLQAKEMALAVRAAENDTLPKLDVGLEASATGQDTTYVGALGQLGTVEARGWSVMLNFSWTPLNRATHAAAELAKIRQSLAEDQKTQLVQKIWLEVREAVRNGDSADRQLRAAATFRGLAEKSLEIEHRKFLNGNSSNIVVAQRQEELANARLEELRALLAQKRATASLLKATGQLLDQRHIELAIKKR